MFFLPNCSKEDVETIKNMTRFVRVEVADRFAFRVA